MCCCVSHPNVNGEPGYRWNPTDPPSIRQPDPPELPKGVTPLYDLPGRCGGVDAHHEHIIVGSDSRVYWRHGLGTKVLPYLANASLVLKVLSELDDTRRFWLLHALTYAVDDAARKAEVDEQQRWIRAAQEGRIEVNRRRRPPMVTIMAPKEGAGS